MVSRRIFRLTVFAVAALFPFCSTAGQAFDLTSGEVANGTMMRAAQVNSRCGGENRSPALAWSGAPKATQGFALTMFDSDANGGRGFWHWVVFHIPSDAQSLPDGAGSGAGLPSGAVQGQNDFGDAGYGGPCPPPGSGTHHYTFTLYALPAASLPLDSKATPAAIAQYAKAHALATATLTGIYRR
jgi:hypothetical protein